MHLADGTIPALQAAAYSAAAAGAVGAGISKYIKRWAGSLEMRIMTGVFAAFIFVSTVFEIPMPFGSTEHITGTPLVAIFAGPFVTVLASAAALLIELAFREGGLTTLGANILSLGFVGGLSGWGIFRLLRRTGAGLFLSGFAAGFAGDLLVYTATALQLAAGGLQGAPDGKNAFVWYLLMFVPGQVPLAIIEGIVTGLILRFVALRRSEMLERFGVDWHEK